MIPSGPEWVPCDLPRTTYTTEYTTDYSIDWTERFGQEKANDYTETVAPGPVDSLRFSRDIDYMRDSSGLAIQRYLIGITAHHTQIALQISPRSPAVAKFLSSCKAFSPEQALLQKEIDNRKAAEAAAELARQEQARIAAEEARIAQEKTAEEERLAKLRDDAEAARRFEVNHKLAQSEVTKYLGMGTIPPCNKPYEANFALQDTSGHMAIEVYPKHETIVINAMGDIKPTFDIRGRKKNSDYFIVGPSNGPLYVDVDLPQTLLGKNFDEKAVLVYKEGLNVGGQTYSLWAWIPVDAIRFCDQ